MENFIFCSIFGCSVQVIPLHALTRAPCARPEPEVSFEVSRGSMEGTEPWKMYLYLHYCFVFMELDTFHFSVTQRPIYASASVCNFNLFFSLMSSFLK